MARVCALPTITDDSALGGSVIERSLRFDRSDTSYLSKTFSSAGNRRTFTFSSWIKLSGTGQGNSGAFFSGSKSGVGFFKFMFRDDGRIELNTSETSYSDSSQLRTTAHFRDTSAWYHVVAAYDTTQGTASDRVKLYVNGTQITEFGTNTLPPQNHEVSVNADGEHQIGNQVGATNYLDGYLAEVHFVDGYAYDPSYFGFTESQTNIWMPKRYGGTYGTNGFYLNFSTLGETATTMGLDRSGNNHNFTPTNLEISDFTLDTPSNNFATLNTLSTSVNTLSQGNLYSTGGGASWRPVSSNMAMSSGRWYWEVYIDTVSSYQMHGIRPQVRDDGDVNHDNDHYPGTRSDEWGYNTDARLHNSASATSSWGDTYAAGDIIRFALDMDAGTLNIYKNGSSTGSQITGISASHSPSGSRGDYLVCLCVYGSTGQAIINFGQEGTFAGHKTAQNNTDINGIGNFFYTPPTGFKALCSANLRGTSSYIIEPQKHFDTILYTGQDTSSLYNVTGLEFAPDFVWAKTRTTSMDSIFIDTVRGNDKQLNCPDYSAEVTRGTPSYRFLKDGFAVSTGGNMNNPQNYAAWCWKAGGSSNTYNIDGTGYGTASAAGLDGGTIDPTGASINTEAGFSIITYTGNGSAGSTVAHGLGKKPVWRLIKRRDASDNWMTYHQGANNFTDPEDYYFELNANGGDINSTIAMNDTAPTSSVFSLGSDNSVNGNTATYVAYCWSEISGYSKFGTYRGNGSSSNGSYVHLGFRPAFILMKKFSGSDNWELVDSARVSYNDKSASLFPNSTDTESTSSRVIDFLSDGFKHYNANGNTNSDGHDYIYMAFAERAGQTPYGTFPNAR